MNIRDRLNNLLKDKELKWYICVICEIAKECYILQGSSICYNCIKLGSDYE